MFNQLIDNIVSGQAAASGEIEKIGQEAREKNTALDAETRGLKAPKFEQVKFEQPKATSPYEAWASTAMTVALLGSAFSRTPMVTAMNAAGAAIKAYKDGDKQTFDAAYKKFEVDSRNAQTAFQHEIKAYEEALRDVTARRAQSDREEAEQIREVMDRWRVIATATQNVTMQELAKDRTGNSAFNRYKQLLLANDALEKSHAALTPVKAQSDALEAFYRIPANAGLYKRSQMRGTDGQMTPDAATALWELYSRSKKAGLIPKDKDPTQSDAFRLKSIQEWEKSKAGLANSNAQAQNAAIQAAASDPNIYTNPVAQLAMIDRYLVLVSNSNRPGLAQFHKTLTSQSMRAHVEVETTGRISGILLGKDTVGQIKQVAQEETNAAKQGYMDYLRSVPVRKDLATQWGLFDDLGDNKAPTYSKPEHVRDALNQRKINAEEAQDILKKQFGFN